MRREPEVQAHDLKDGKPDPGPSLWNIIGTKNGGMLPFLHLKSQVIQDFFAIFNYGGGMNFQ